MKNALKHIDRLIEANTETFDKEQPYEWFRFRTDDVLLRVNGDDIEIDFKGTERAFSEWFYNFWTFRREWFSMGCVERGFSFNAEEIAGGEHEPLSLISRCLSFNGKIIMRGHSRGAVLAPLVATIFVWHGINPNRISLHLFAAPKLGNKKFLNSYTDMLGDKTFVINGSRDWVTYVPTWSRRVGIVKKFKGGALHALKVYRKAIKQML